MQRFGLLRTTLRVGAVCAVARTAVRTMAAAAKDTEKRCMNMWVEDLRTVTHNQPN